MPRPMTAVIASFIFAAMFAITTGTRADTVSIKVFQTPVEIDVPDGFCLMSEDKNADNQLINFLKTANQGVNTFHLAMANCAQLKLWRLGLLPSLSEYAYVASPTALERESLDMPRDAFVSEIARQMGSPSGKALSESAFQEGIRRAEAAFPDDAGELEVGQTSDLGILNITPDGIITGNLANMTVSDQRAITVLGTASFTLLNGKVIYLFLFTDGSKTKLEPFVTNSKAWLDATVAANE